MKTLIAFLLLLISNSANAQAIQDTFDLLQQKAKDYLGVVYKENYVDSGIHTWDNAVIEDLESFYKKKYRKSVSRSQAINNLKSDFKVFQQFKSSFFLREFIDKNIEYYQGNPRVYFQYTYTVIEKGVSKNKDAYIYFIYDRKINRWTIVDYRIPEILGKPKMWAK